MKAILVLSLLLAFQLAAKADWKAGFAVVDITPKEPLLLSGYASRTEPAKEVLDELHAKALALEDDEGKRALVCCLARPVTTRRLAPRTIR